MFKIDKKSIIPIYYQMREGMLEQIKNGKLRIGDPIPPEMELCKKYGLSRTPVRQAIGELVKDGILYRERGKGTFVNKLSRDDKRLIGILVPCVRKTSAVADVIRGVEDIAHEKGYSLILCNTDHNFEKEEVYAIQLISNKVAGVIFYPLDNDKEYFEGNIHCVNRFIRHGAKVVLVDKTLKKGNKENEFDYVVTDNFQGAYDLTSHLIKVGHSRIGFLSAPYCNTVEDRLNGYKKVLEDNGFAFNASLVKVKARGTDEEDVTLTKEFLSMEERPTAIFAINDIVAKNVLMTLQEEGIDVPSEIAVVGYDDIHFASSLNPPLTTVRQPLYEEGKIAASILIDRIEGKVMGKQQVELKSELIVRESCGVKLKDKEVTEVSV